MSGFNEVIAQPGERHLVYGGTRAGKSSFIDWQMREISRTRPSCMQILVDTKPRFRAETERMRFDPTGKKGRALLGDISTGRRDQWSPIAWWLIFGRHIPSEVSGRVPVKSPSCSRVRPRNGQECFIFSWRSPGHTSGPESVISRQMRSWISTDGILGPSIPKTMFSTLLLDQEGNVILVKPSAASECSDYPS